MASRCRWVFPVVFVTVAFVACGGTKTNPPDLGPEIDEDTGDNGIDLIDVKDVGPEDVGGRDVLDVLDVPELLDGDGGTEDIPPEAIDVGPDTFVCTIDTDCPDDSTDTCSVGKCQGGHCTLVTRNCSDGLDCTYDPICSPGVQGGCSHIYQADKPCAGCNLDADCYSPDPCVLNTCVPCPISNENGYDEFTCPTSGKVCKHVTCAGCNDNNPCTTDRCDATGKVFNTPVNCTDFNPCTTDTCHPNPSDPNLGYRCEHTSADQMCIVCSAADQCNTINTNPSPNCFQGSCTTIPVEDGAAVCGRGILCPTGTTCDATQGLCMTKVCTYEAKPCDDGDPCTADSCDAQNGCTHTCVCTSPCTTASVAGESSTECNDDNACTLDQCVQGSATGVCASTSLTCVHTTINCDDGDDTTFDTCDPTLGCQHKTLPPVGQSCKDSDCQTIIGKCGVGICDTPNGPCDLTLIDCDDGDPCTQDGCSATTGCQHINIANCGAGCKSVIDCEDRDPCTTDTCVDGNCHHSANPCNDGNQCTLDLCIPGTGCTHVDITECAIPCKTDEACKPASLCAVGTCNHATGRCDVADKDCNDNNPCTVDTCDPLSGTCQYALVSNPPPECVACTAGDDTTCAQAQTDPCYTARCDTMTLVCVSFPVDCDDQDSCTTDSCVKGTGECLHTPPAVLPALPGRPGLRMLPDAELLHHRPLQHRGGPEGPVRVGAAELQQRRRPVPERHVPAGHLPVPVRQEELRRRESLHGRPVRRQGRVRPRNEGLRRRPAMHERLVRPDHRPVQVHAGRVRRQ